MMMQMLHAGGLQIATDGTEIHSSLAQATNLFVRHDGRWRLVVHHASPVPYIPPVHASGARVN